MSETPIRPKNASSGIFSIAFHDAMRGTAVGGDYAKPTDSPPPNVLTTTDSGQTWRVEVPTDPSGLFLSSVAYSSGVATWVSGSGGANFHKDGAGWVNEGKQPFNALAFPSAKVGWAVGPKGTVARWSAEGRVP